MIIILGLIISYLLGSVPFAFIITKAAKNIDLRTVGSGNVGATNAMRVVGFKLGFIALILDALKGIIPVVFFAHAINTPGSISLNTLRLIMGIASICGHNWTIFLKFKGGKGIATSFGVLIGLAITSIVFAKILGLIALIWALTFLLSGYVSLASMLSAVFLPFFLLAFKLNVGLIFFGSILSIFALYRHKSNIHRLLHHKENRFDIKSKLASLKKKALS